MGLFNCFGMISQVFEDVKLKTHGLEMHVPIASNPDVTCPNERKTVPGCGALAAFIENASGVNALFIGKPNPLMMGSAITSLGIHSENAVMAGGRMDTDIIAGVQTGMDTILVLSGVTRLEEVVKFPYLPTSICNSAAETEVWKNLHSWIVLNFFAPAGDNIKITGYDRLGENGLGFLDNLFFAVTS